MTEPPRHNYYFTAEFDKTVSAAAVTYTYIHRVQLEAGGLYAPVRTVGEN